MTLKIVGYTRVSTEEQKLKGISLKAQEQKLREYASLYNLDILTILSDPGWSAKNLQRPGLIKALNLLDDNIADGILVYKLDRLIRNVSDCNLLINKYFAIKKHLFVVSEQIDTRTAAGRLGLNIIASVAQWEREAIGERTKAAMSQKQKMGEHCGRIPYGYKLENGKLTPGDNYHVIQLIRKLRKKKLSYKAIAAELNREGILSPSGLDWSGMSVKRIVLRKIPLV